MPAPWKSLTLVDSILQDSKKVCTPLSQKSDKTTQPCRKSCTVVLFVAPEILPLIVVRDYEGEGLSMPSYGQTITKVLIVS